MAYIRALIETCETFGWNGGPLFDTRVVQMANGRERRNANWAQYRSKYELPFQNIDASQYRNIRQMFEVCRGQLHCFLYRDRLADEATNQLIGYGDGAIDTFQLSTLSALDGITFQRAVYAIADDAEISVSVNGVPTTAFALDRDRGLIIFDDPPAMAAEIRWSGRFLVWVRFANDWLPFSIDNKNAGGFFHNGTIDLFEMPPPEIEESSS